AVALRVGEARLAVGAHALRESQRLLVVRLLRRDEPPAATAAGRRHQRGGRQRGGQDHGPGSRYPCTLRARRPPPWTSHGTRPALSRPPAAAAFVHHAALMVARRSCATILGGQPPDTARNACGFHVNPLRYGSAGGPSHWRGTSCDVLRNAKSRVR